MSRVIQIKIFGLDKKKKKKYTYIMTQGDGDPIPNPEEQRVALATECNKIIADKELFFGQVLSFFPDEAEAFLEKAKSHKEGKSWETHLYYNLGGGVDFWGKDSTELANELIPASTVIKAIDAIRTFRGEKTTSDFDFGVPFSFSQYDIDLFLAIKILEAHDQPLEVVLPLEQQMIRRTLDILSFGPEDISQLRYYAEQKTISHQLKDAAESLKSRAREINYQAQDRVKRHFSPTNQ